MGTGFGSVGRAVASNSRGPLTVNCIEKTKINKKRQGMAHFYKTLIFSRHIGRTSHFRQQRTRVLIQSSETSKWTPTMTLILSWKFCIVQNCRNEVVNTTFSSSINSNIFFTFENSLSGVVGIAWLGTVCESDLGYRTSVIEFLQSDLITAWVGSSNQRSWNYLFTLMRRSLSLFVDICSFNK